MQMLDDARVEQRLVELSTLKIVQL